MTIADRTAQNLWQSLTPAWQQAYEQAWASWCAGSLGIGAVLIEPGDDNRIITVGHNRVNDQTGRPRLLSGNFMAHAEMNALAALTRLKANDLHLYTTLQPCLMCSATAVFMHVAEIRYAAADEFFEGLDDLWDHHPYSRRWKPAEIGPLAAPLSSFARLLPLTVQATEAPGSPVMDQAHRQIPDVAALAVELVADRSLERVALAGGSVIDGLDSVWGRLPRTGAPTDADTDARPG